MKSVKRAIKKFKSFSPTKRKLIYAISGIVIIAIVFFSVIFWPEGPPEVAVTTIESGSIQSKIETSGTVTTENSSKYTLPEGTYVKEVKVKVGSMVKKGDLLASFDASSVWSLLSSKKADYQKAASAYNDYKASVKNAKASIPHLESQIKELSVKIAETEREIAQESKQTSENTEAETETETETTTSPSQSGSFFDELNELLTNLVNMGATIKDLNDMFENFNNINKTSYDMSSLMAQSMDTPQNRLISYKLQLISLNTQLTANKTTAKGTLDSVYKSIADKAYDDMKATENEIKALEEGWFAEYDGVVTAVNIAENTAFIPEKRKSSGVDVGTLISMLSQDGDINSLVSAFLNGGNKNIGIEIKNYEGFIATISLDKYNLQEVKVGQKVRVESVNDREYEGEVVYVAAEATEKTSLDIASLAGSLTGGSGTASGAVCKIKIYNPDEAVVVGFDVDLEIITAVVENVPIVPVEAVRYDNKGMFVWKINEKKKTVSKAYVSFGVSEDTKYELISGVELGDLIINNPPLSLEDGDKVSVKKD